MIEYSPNKIYATTILGIHHKNQVALAGDGQVTIGDTVMKHSAEKIRRLYNRKIIAGFAGAAADAFTLFDRFEEKLERYSGNLPRAAVELAKDWRSDRYLRRLEALLAVLDSSNIFIISGSGEIIEPDDGIAAIGSGGPFALAAARCLVKYSDLTAEEIAREALLTASQICIYTNDNVKVEVL